MKDKLPRMRCRRFRKGTVAFCLLLFLGSALFARHLNEHLEQLFMAEDIVEETTADSAMLEKMKEAHELQDASKSIKELIKTMPKQDSEKELPIAPPEELKPKESETPKAPKPKEPERAVDPKKPEPIPEQKPKEPEEKPKKPEEKPKEPEEKPKPEAVEEKEAPSKKSSEASRPTNPAYIEALEKVMSPDRVVLLALVDIAFVSMAVNFYFSSIQPFGIQNYLILTMHKDSCAQLAPHNINCFQYRDNIDGNSKANEVGTPEFIAKMNVRTDMIIDALQADISVLHSDTDVHFAKNPFEHIHCKRSDCDVAALVDYYVANAGFLLVHPSALPLYLAMRELSIKEPKMNDQDQLNKCLGKLSRDKTIRVKRLPKSEFQSGKLYYDDGARIYADSAQPCPECIVVHNNWIIGLENKVYRAKEMHQWVVDDGKYYTSKTRKYLTYDNVKPYTKDSQIQALKSALAMARILNRIVILPKFYDDEGKECGFHGIVRMKYFDPKFSGVYREHSFLPHPLVPKEVTGSVKKVAVDKSSLSDKNVKDRYGNIAESILYFEKIDFGVSFNAEQNHFDGLIKRGLVTH